MNPSERVTLTRRLTLFFLASHALVLVGFSVALYLLANRHLHRQLEDRLVAAAHTLASAAEIGPDGVEWELSARPHALAPGGFGDQLEWAVATDSGRIVDRSAQAGLEPLLAASDAAFQSGHRNPRRLDHAGHAWQITRIRVEPGTSIAKVDRPRPGAPAHEVNYSALVLTVAVPLDPVLATLRTLAATLAVLTLAVLFVALLGARAVCRRALVPVSQMAVAARSMGAADLTSRLPTPSSADELADLGAAFNGLLDRLGEAFERERRFAGEASHQLRTPLAAVIGQVEVALRRERSPEEYRRVLDCVLSQAERLRRVSEALLFLARSEADAGLPGRERIELNAWTIERLRGWRDHPRAADLTFEPADESIAVRVHSDLFGELLGVLLDNAFKYSRPGTPVVVRIGRTAANVWLEVEDRGDGIAPDDRARLFRPFFRSESARRQGVAGAGLGLAVATRIAAALGGAMTVESEVGRGSRFRVTLPVSEVEAVERKRESVDDSQLVAAIKPRGSA
jgi:signal transduction histidine kinase